jgi:hypothetical protein
MEKLCNHKDYTLGCEHCQNSTTLKQAYVYNVHDIDGDIGQVIGLIKQIEIYHLQCADRVRNFSYKDMAIFLIEQGYRK